MNIYEMINKKAKETQEEIIEINNKFKEEVSSAEDDLYKTEIPITFTYKELCVIHNEMKSLDMNNCNRHGSSPMKITEKIKNLIEVHYPMKRY